MTTKRPSRILCLLEQGIDHPIERRILSGLRAAVEERGYEMVSGVIPIDPRAETLRLIKMLGSSLAGVAIQPYRPNREMAELLLTPPLSTMPHVMIGHYHEHLSVNSCVIDNYGGMYAATRLLLDHGRRRPAFLGEISMSSTEHERYLGFCMACLHAGIAVPPERFIDLYHEADLRVRLEQVYTQPHAPDSFVCLHDGVAVRLIRVLGAMGISIPQQVSVISFGDDMDLAESVSPALSTAVHPAETMGSVAAHLLINGVEGLIPEEPTLWVVPVTMKRRDSCGTRTPAEPEVESIPFSGFAGVSITLEEARAAATRHTA
jgi:LacI family transcriptional regulator